MSQEPDAVEIVEDDMTIVAEFISDEGLAVTWSAAGHAQEPIAIPLAEGKETLNRADVEGQLEAQIPTAAVAQLLLLLDERYPDAFDRGIRE